MIRTITTTLLIAFCCAPAIAEDKPLWLVVGKAGLVDAIEPLAEHRRGEGFETVISTHGIEKALAAAPRRPDFLLLLGDDEPGKESEPWYLPAKRMPFYRWRDVQRREFASDAAWGDLDGDLVPDVPVGRIPARTPEQVERIVKKILAFERQPPTAADLQLPVWGGSPQYGAAIDTMVSGLLLGMLQMNAPRWVSPWVVSSNPNHPLCGWPADQPARFTGQIRQGGILGTLMGHADAERFFSMTHDGRQIWYTATDAEAALIEGPPAPPLVFFSCESGDFTRETACMAEAMLFLPAGPVATVAATTESHPLTNYFSGVSLLRSIGGPEKRLGVIHLAAQRRAMKARNFVIERVLRDVEGKLEETIDTKKLRRDQVLMYALLGDPATRLRIPEPLQARVESTENGWQWHVERPEGATRLEVALRSANSPGAAWQEKPPQAAQARAAFDAANAALGFVAVSTFPADKPWQGTVDSPGWIRLVATGDGRILAIALELK